MKMKGLKKLLVSLGLCAVLTVGMSTAAFADSTEAILAPAPEESSIPEVPVLSTEEVDNATYVGSTSNIVQTAATETSISLAWNKVEGATKYTIRIKSSNGARRAAAERAAINAPMQGTAADILKRAMIAVDAWLQAEQPRVRMIMQVHDELVLEAVEAELPKVEEILKEAMEKAVKLSVPLTIDINVGKTWAEAK